MHWQLKEIFCLNSSSQHGRDKCFEIKLQRVVGGGSEAEKKKSSNVKLRHERRSHIQQQSLMISQFLAICLYEQNLLSLVNPISDWKTKTEQLSKVKLWKSLLRQFAKITVVLNVIKILCLWGFEGSTYFLLHHVTKFHKLILIIFLTYRITKTL